MEILYGRKCMTFPINLLSPYRLWLIFLQMLTSGKKYPAQVNVYSCTSLFLRHLLKYILFRNPNPNRRSASCLHNNKMLMAALFHNPHPMPKRLHFAIVTSKGFIN